MRAGTLAVLLAACAAPPVDRQPTALAEAVGPEQALSPRVAGARDSFMQGVRAAPGPADSSVVYWYDVQFQSVDDAFAGLRLDGAAAQLNPDGHFTFLGNQGSSAGLAWNGSSWLLVVFIAEGGGGTVSSYAQPLDGSGAPIVRAEVPYAFEARAVASDGNHFLITGTQSAIADAAGSQVAASSVTGSAAAFDGARYWVLDGSAPITATPVSPATAQAAGAAVPIASGTDPAIACGGGTCLVTWLTDQLAIDAATLSPAGAVGSAVEVSSGFVQRGAPGVAFSGGEFWVGWAERANAVGTLLAARVSTTGAPLDAGGFAVAPDIACCLDPDPPALVATSDGVIASWVSSDTQVHAIHVAADATVGAETVASAFASEQLSATIASDGSAFLAAWFDSRGGSNAGGGAYDLYAAPLGADGAPIAAPFALPSVPDGQNAVALAWDGSAWLAATGGDTTTALVRFASDGGVLGSAALAVTEVQGVASPGDGRGALVTARDAIQPIDGTGTPGAAIPLEDAPLGRTAAWTGSDYAIVWAGSNGIELARLPLGGSAADVAPTAIATGTFATIACSPGDCLVVTVDDVSTLTALRLVPGAPPVAIAPAMTNFIDEADVAWDGTQYVVATREEYELSPTTFVYTVDASNAAVLVTEDTNYGIGTELQREYHHPFVAAAGEAVAVAYSRHVSLGDPLRAFARIVTPAPPGAEAGMTPPHGGGGGCCDAGGTPPAAPAMLVALLAFRRRRRP